MSATTTPVKTTPDGRPVEPRSHQLYRWGLTLAILVPFLWSAWGLEFSPARLLSAPGQIWAILREMVPPEAARIGEVMAAIVESLYIAWVGTLIAAAFSFVLAFLAARNLTSSWVGAPTRFVLSAIRAFPELLLAILFIPMVGLGPFVGVLAVGIHSIGTLGKLSTEVIEGIDDGPVESIRATGGGAIARLRYGVAPQVLPTIVAYWLYRFEINIRASAILGLVGAGGVGAKLSGFLKFRDFPAAGTVLIATILTVLVIDAVSGRIRRRIITGEAQGPPWRRHGGPAPGELAAEGIV